MGKESDTSERRLRAKERRLKSWELRKQGWTQRDIARHFGVSHQLISNELKEAYAEYRRQYEAEAAETGRLDLARLDDWLKAIQPQIDQGDLKAIQTGVLILKQRSRITGHDAPISQKIALTSEEDLDAEQMREKIRLAMTPPNQVLIEEK